MQLHEERIAEPVAQPPIGSAAKPGPVAQPRAIEWIAVGAIFWVIAACLQWKVGAFAVEFGSNADESAHYITGLMIRDYIVSVMSGHFTSPLAYAENYYVHYPKVSIGIWPPLFHVTEAFWGLIFSPARISILFLMALITASIGTSIYLLLRRQYPMAWAFAGGALFVISPLIQTSTQAVMADGLVALLDFWAMIFLIRYLEQERSRDAMLFGVFVGLSMATKANGVALLLLPLIAMLITRRFQMLRTRWFYYSGAVVLVLGVPWQVWSYYLIYRSHVMPQVSLAYRFHMGHLYGLVLLAALGWGFSLVFLLGIAIFLIRLWRGRLDMTLACALALLLSVWIYHSALGFGENRWMLGALPPAILFVVAGFAGFVRYISLHTAPFAARSISLVALAAGIFALQPWAVPRKLYQGFDQPAHFLLSNDEFSGGNFLVVSNALGEGAFISEVAMHERRPSHVILRSSKFLGSSTWNGTDFQLRYNSAAELREFLDHAPIDAVILDIRTGQIGQQNANSQLQEQVTQALSSNPHWKFRDGYPKLPDHSPWINLYSRVGARPPGDIRLDMRYMLSRDIVYTDSKRGHGQAGAAH